MDSKFLEKVEDTSAEYFPGIYCRFIITADDEKTVRKAADDVTGSPEVVIGRLEGGIERQMGREETPDHRSGELVHLWGQIFPNKPFDESLVNFATELSYNIRQRVLVKLFTAVYDFMKDPDGKIDTLDRIGHCGDGWEVMEEHRGRDTIVVPIMVPNFRTERYLGYSTHGIMGVGLWAGCRSKKAVKQVEVKALEAINEVEGVVTPFDVCSAGSKPGGKYKWMGPTTNEEYCPSLKERLKEAGRVSKVPERVKYIPEIVIDAISMDAMRRAMKVGIETLYDTSGVEWISAANFGGKLGEYQIKLHDLFD
jgi:formylmethanofuran--tetrahydromethanopterin N-formyltransferase